MKAASGNGAAFFIEKRKESASHSAEAPVQRHQSNRNLIRGYRIINPSRILRNKSLYLRTEFQKTNK